MKKILLGTILIAMPVIMLAQSGGLDPAETTKPLHDEWTSYSGDLSGKRYSGIKEINTQTVKNLSLEWMAQGIDTGCGPEGTGQAGAAPAGAGGFGGFGGGGGRGGRGGGGGAAAPIIVDGFGTGEVNNCGPARFGGGVLYVGGVIYASAPDNVFA